MYRIVGASLVVVSEMSVKAAKQLYDADFL